MMAKSRFEDLLAGMLEPGGTSGAADPWDEWVAPTPHAAGYPGQDPWRASGFGQNMFERVGNLPGVNPKIKEIGGGAYAGDPGYTDYYFNIRNEQLRPSEIFSESYQGEQYTTQAGAREYLFGSTAESFRASYRDALKQGEERKWSRITAGSGYLRAVASHYVIDSGGYEPDEFGLYSWGELAKIYEDTTASQVAEQYQSLLSGGELGKAQATASMYGYSPPAPGEGGGVPNIPEDPGDLDQGTLDFLYSARAHATGQRDVRMEPGLVASLLTDRPLERQSKRRYKGGTRVSGLLGTLQLGQQRLGGE